MAYEISGKDKDFVKTLVAENGTVTPRRQSEVIKNGIREPSFGICQIHCGHHKDLCGSYTKPNWEGFYDWKWQVETCWDLYSKGTPFYGYYNRHKTTKLLTFLD